MSPYFNGSDLPGILDQMYLVEMTCPYLLECCVLAAGLKYAESWRQWRQGQLSRRTGLGALGGGDKFVHLGALCQNGRNRFSISRLWGQSSRGTRSDASDLCILAILIFILQPNIYMAMGNIFSYSF